MTVHGVPGASCGEDKTHVALLAAFTAGLKVKDSHRGDARPIWSPVDSPSFSSSRARFSFPPRSPFGFTTVQPGVSPPYRAWDRLLPLLDHSDGANVNRGPYHWWTQLGCYQLAIGVDGVTSHWRPPNREVPLNLPRVDRRRAYQGACRDSTCGSRPVEFENGAQQRFATLCMSYTRELPSSFLIRKLSLFNGICNYAEILCACFRTLFLFYFNC